LVVVREITAMNRQPSRAPRASLESLESRVVLSVLAPTGLDATLVEPRGVRVTWNDVTGETGYLVERRVDGTDEPWRVVGDPGADVTTFTQDGLTPGRTYLFRVRARDASGTSDASNVDFVTIPGDGVPDAPRELVAESVQGLFVRLRWANVEGENGFRVERRLDGTDNWVEIGNTAANVLTFADERVEPGRTYVYRVRAFNGAGTSPYSNVAFATLQGEPGVPAAPRELNAELTDALRVRVTWQDVANETGYKVERRLDGTIDWTQIGTTAQNVVNFVDERVEAGKAYIYRVRAFNDAGNSSYSNTDAVRIPGGPEVPAAPRLEVDLVAPRAARLRWTDVANETGYSIERRVDGSEQPFAEIRRVNAGVTTITDDGLEPGKTYIYRVRAFNAVGNSPYSNTGVARVLLEGLPTAPRELRATVVSPTRVDLRWIDSTGETAYRIERRVDGTDAWVKIGNAPQDATTFSDTTAQPGKTYLYRVRADNAVGHSPWSNVAVARTPGEGGVPAAPRELDASLVEGRVRLRWLDVSGEQGYRVERRLDGSDDWVQIGTTGENVTTFVDERVDRGRTYVYRVRAFNAAGNSPYSNTDAVTIPEATVPAAPRLEAQRVALRAVRLAWTNVASETGYRVYRRVDGSDQPYTLLRTVGANVTSITDEGLEVGKTYLYKVLAFNGAGNSPFSNVRSVAITETFRPAAPRELRATAVSPTRVDLTWLDVRGDTGYRIERRLAGTDQWVKLGYSGPSVTRFSDTTAEPGRTYQYRVRAGGVGASSEWSNVATATTPAAPPTNTVFSATRIKPLELEGA
jgi:fibronectin type 3 domain-containing protein